MEIANAIVVWLLVGCSAVFTRVDGEVAYGLTAAHCGVTEGEQVNARLGDRVFGCRVVSVDPVRDMALLKCYASEIPAVDLPIASAVAGSDVLLVGFPRGRLTVLPGVMQELSLPMGRSYKQVITTEEPVEGGFSGGAVISEDGLVGIVTHSAKTEAGQGAGCSLTDRLIESAASRALKTEPIQGLSLRDLLASIVGVLLARFFPGLIGRPPPVPPEEPSEVIRRPRPR